MIHKRHFIIGLILLLLIFITNAVQSPIFAQGEIAIRVSPASASLPQNTTAALYIIVENVTDLFDVSLNISFDPTKLAVMDANPGKAGIQIENGSFISPDYEAVNEVNGGEIIYRVTVLPPNPAGNGNGVLAKVTFLGITQGTSHITVGAVLKDSEGNLISHTSHPGTITIPTPDTPTSTPTDSMTPTPSATPPTTPTSTATPATSTPMPTATPTPKPAMCNYIQGYHIVRPGETLYAIGRAYATKPASIAICNGIINFNALYVGTRLSIPIDSWFPIPPGPTAQRQFGIPNYPTPPSTCRYFHTVKYGETLSLIAWRYGVNLWELARANNIYNLNLIYTGMVLCVP